MIPQLEAFDHIHVFVADRRAAEDWYARVMGLTRNQELAFWAEGGGPLTIQNASGSIHIALFERPREACRSVVALRTNASDYRAWREHLKQALAGQVTEEDHQASMSLYFRDPDGNPYEITTYEVQALKR